MNNSNLLAPPRRHWLCVAYAFPPINRSGTQRTLGFVRLLDTLGWDADVLTVQGDAAEPTDASLTNQVPSSTTVVRVPWINLVDRLSRFVRKSSPGGKPSPNGQRRATVIRKVVYPTSASAKSEPRPGHSYTKSQGQGSGLRRPRLIDWLSQLLMTPDSRIGWIPAAVRGGLITIHKRRPDVIYSTSPYMSAHLIALILNRLTAIPWVADFRDPWRGNPFRSLGYRSLDLLDAWLERLVLRTATHIVFNTPTMHAQAAARLPCLTSKSTTIMNGFDADEFRDIRPIRLFPPEEFVLTHCGEFYGPRSPSPWLTAVALLCRRSTVPRRIHLLLIGPDAYGGRRLARLADEIGLADCVTVLGRKSRRETLAHMAGSDALILAGSNGMGSQLQVPGKLFEYLAVRRPIIASLAPDNPAVTILRQARAEAYICPPDDPSALAGAISQLAAHPRPKVADAWSSVGRFDRAYRAQELLAVFNRIANTAQ